jgi:aspartyl-tRNA(Asn)/glutamyl-tRNA(Gln) amidotransferase subunit C
MQIDDKLLTKLEKLSSLTIGKEKRAEIEEQLSDIVGFVENLNELDTDGIEATFSPITDGATLREDEVCKNETVSQDILATAPKSEEGFFIVPKVIG